MSAALNFVGAFISISIAATIAKGIINPTVLAGGEGLVLVFAALIGAIVWNLITWYLAIPSSSSHALIGGVIGATIVASGAGAVKVHKLVQSVIVPAVLSPVICGAVAHGDISATHFYVPIWVKAACALAIALGTASGGWRTINTMGSGLTEVEAPQGFAAESSSAAVILVSSYYGYPLSTTQVVSGGVMGAGLGRRLASVHWNVAGQTVAAWLFTIPSAALLGAGAWEISDDADTHRPEAQAQGGCRGGEEPTLSRSERSRSGIVSWPPRPSVSSSCPCRSSTQQGTSTQRACHRPARAVQRPRPTGALRPPPS